MDGPPADGDRDHSLRVAEARWRAVIDAAVDGIVVIDARGTIEAFNLAAQRMFGYGEADVVGRNVRMLMPEPDHSRHDEYISRHIQTGERRIIGIGRAVIGLRRSGDTFPVHLSVGEMQIDGAPHFTGILHDLSAQTDLEDRLREATALARLGEMAAVIAHEVKNPLAAVRGAIQVIGGRMPKGAPDTAVVKEIIARIDGLNDLIQDLLVFARPPEPKFTVTDVHALLTAIADLLKRDPAFSSLEITLSGQVSPLSADANLLTIVFQNILMNAAQATRGRGAIGVDVREAGGRHQVVVTDDGPGIPAEIKATLFRPFKSTKARGTGLGMATAKRLVELHGGRIQVESPAGGGTAVTIELPSRAAGQE